MDEDNLNIKYWITVTQLNNIHEDIAFFRKLSDADKEVLFFNTALLWHHFTNLYEKSMEGVHSVDPNLMTDLDKSLVAYLSKTYLEVGTKFIKELPDGYAYGNDDDFDDDDDYDGYDYV